MASAPGSSSSSSGNNTPSVKDLQETAEALALDRFELQTRLDEALAALRSFDGTHAVDVLCGDGDKLSSTLLITNIGAVVTDVAIGTRIDPLGCARRTRRFALFNVLDPVEVHRGTYGVLAEFKSPDDAKFARSMLDRQQVSGSTLRCLMAKEFPCHCLAVHGKLCRVPKRVVVSFFARFGKLTNVTRRCAPGWVLVTFERLEDAVVAFINVHHKLVAGYPIEASFASETSHIALSEDENDAHSSDDDDGMDGTAAGASAAIVFARGLSRDNRQAIYKQVHRLRTLQDRLFNGLCRVGSSSPMPSKVSSLLVKSLLDRNDRTLQKFEEISTREDGVLAGVLSREENCMSDQKSSVHADAIDPTAISEFTNISTTNGLEHERMIQQARSLLTMIDQNHGIVGGKPTADTELAVLKRAIRFFQKSLNAADHRLRSLHATLEQSEIRVRQEASTVATLQQQLDTTIRRNEEVQDELDAERSRREACNSMILDLRQDVEELRAEYRRSTGAADKAVAARSSVKANSEVSQPSIVPGCTKVHTTSNNPATAGETPPEQKERDDDGAGSEATTGERQPPPSTPLSQTAILIAHSASKERSLSWLVKYIGALFASCRLQEGSASKVWTPNAPGLLSLRQFVHQTMMKALGSRARANETVLALESAIEHYQNSIGLVRCFRQLYYGELASQDVRFFLSVEELLLKRSVETLPSVANEGYATPVLSLEAVGELLPHIFPVITANEQSRILEKMQVSLSMCSKPRSILGPMSDKHCYDVYEVSQTLMMLQQKRTRLARHKARLLYWALGLSAVRCSTSLERTMDVLRVTFSGATRYELKQISKDVASRPCGRDRFSAMCMSVRGALFLFELPAVDGAADSVLSKALLHNIRRRWKDFRVRPHGFNVSDLSTLRGGAAMHPPEALLQHISLLNKALETGESRLALFSYCSLLTSISDMLCSVSWKRGVLTQAAHEDECNVDTFEASLLVRLNDAKKFGASSSTPSMQERIEMEIAKEEQEIQVKEGDVAPGFDDISSTQDELSRRRPRSRSGSTKRALRTSSRIRKRHPRASRRYTR